MSDKWIARAAAFLLVFAVGTPCPVSAQSTGGLVVYLHGLLSGINRGVTGSTSLADDIRCGEFYGAASDCIAREIVGQSFTMTANTLTNGVRYGTIRWDCDGLFTGTDDSITVTMPGTGGLGCNAIFTPVAGNFVLGISWGGGGTVTSSPAAITCPFEGGTSRCQSTFTGGTVVTLTASADSEYLFRGWSGDCSGTGATATVTVDRDKNCGVTFERQAVETQRSLTVSLAGSGSGTVTSSPAGISCASSSSGSCSASFANNSTVTLTATPTSGSVFAGWSGSCSGTASSASLTLSADASCLASFVLGSTLTISFSGAGSGSVTSSPAGIACTSEATTPCSATFQVGATVSLTATANSGSRFARWSGCATSSQATISVTMTAAATCAATFSRRLVVPQTGWWWNASEPGRGYSIETQGEDESARLFLAAFMYRGNGTSVWYVAQMTANSDGTGFTGALYEYEHGQTLFGSHREPSPLGRIGGSGAVLAAQFTTSTEGIITLPPAGAFQAATAVSVTRFPFVDDGLSTSLPTSGSLPEKGWWWNPSESGTGVFFEVQATSSGATSFFVAFYAYDQDGSARWYYGQGQLVETSSAANALSVPLAECQSGLALGQTGIRVPTCTLLSGITATFQFQSSGRTATVTLIHRRITLQRFQF